MYAKILLALGNSPADRPIIDHIKQLAAIMHSRIVLIHVATGPSAQFHGANAAGEEIEEIHTYLESIRSEFAAESIPAEIEVGFGDPAREIVKWVTDHGCDLVAMGTHGHKLLADMLLGTTASRVQHNISVPVLLLRAK